MRILQIALLALLSFSIFLSCSSQEEELPMSETLFSFISPKHSGVEFENTLIETVDSNPLFYDYYYNGAGVGMGDINGDGMPDLFFAGNNKPSKLYLNKGNFQFEDITSKAGIKNNGKWATGVNMIDINNDGLLDIYVSYAGPAFIEDQSNELYVNQGNLKFQELAQVYGINDTGYSTHACFFDFDNDKDLDLFVLNHSSFNGALKEFFEKFNSIDEEIRYKNVNHFYVNENGRFIDKTKQFGFDNPSFGLGISASDFNNDGFVDLYIANDFFLPDYYYLNNNGKEFSNQVKTFFKHTPYYAMGVDAGDINNDGHLDLAVVDMTPEDHVRSKSNMPSMNPKLFDFLKNNQNYIPQFMFNSLQLNMGNGFYSDIGLITKTAKTEWSWAPLLADFDNDGYKDFFISNGYRRDTRNNDWREELEKNSTSKVDEVFSKSNTETYFEFLQKTSSTPVSNYIFRNSGKLKMENKTKEWGLTEKSFSNGAAYGDLDMDGDLDLVVNNIDSKAFIYRNDSDKGENDYISFRLLNGSSDALNSKVTLYTSSGKQYVETTNVRGFMSSMPGLAHFGLKSDSEIEKVKVVWPNGNETIINNPARNVLHTLKLKDSHLPKQLNKKKRPMLNDVTGMQSGVTFKHSENNYDDFQKEILLPHKQSTLGPFVTIGDINKDGLEDFFVGGAAGQAGELYQQLPSGKFQRLNSSFLEQDKLSEDMGGVIFDADLDGDNDLYVASGGGGEMQNLPSRLEDRLYLNNGNGVFTKSKNRIPQSAISSGRVIAEDFDGDKDLDLVVMGRTVPGKYPSASKTTFLLNNNGFFEDVTAQLNSSFESLGMITDGCFVDLIGDSKKELVLVGEWSSILIFQWKDGKLQDISEELEVDQLFGWWYSVNFADFNKDGKQDLIIGNIGTNSKFKASEKEPFYVYYNDFDKNGTGDIVLSNKYKDEYVPVRGKQCSTEQMPFIEDKFPSFESFANASLIDVYGEKNLDESVQFKANIFNSIVLLNNGNGFEKYDLPVEAQFSPIHSSVVDDFNNDGNLDVLVVGNTFNTEVETPSYDSGYGVILINEGHKEFSFRPVLSGEHGAVIGKNVKDIVKVKLTEQSIPSYIVSNNDFYLQFLINMSARN